VPSEHASRLRRAVAAAALELSPASHHSGGERGGDGDRDVHGDGGGELLGRAALAGAFALGHTPSRLEGPVSLSQSVLLCARLRQEVDSLERAVWSAQRGIRMHGDPVQSYEVGMSWHGANSQGHRGESDGTGE